MADWYPEITGGAGAIYARLVERLEADIHGGKLRPGARLPPQRILADRIGLSVGTVTKAYVEAERRGLVRGHVGRGTYIAGPDPEIGGPLDGAPVNLSLNIVPHGEASRRFQDTLARLTRRRGAIDLLAYAPAAGYEAHRHAAAQWIERTSCYSPDRSRIVMTAGAQHAMTLAFAAACRPGDLIVCEEASFYGMKSLASYAGYRLAPVAMDEQGITPDALGGTAERRPAALYIMPTVQNPTGRTMSNARREEIVGIARRMDMRIVEDDLYAVFAPVTRTRLRRLAELAPERTFHIAGVSKSLAPGLRTGFLVCPDDTSFDAVIGAMRATVYAPPSIGAAVFAQWMADGTAEAVLELQRNEIVARFDLAHDVLAHWMERTAVPAPHVWLPMSEIDAERIAGRALRAGVAITPPAALSIGGSAAAGLRLCIGAPASRGELARALDVVRQAIVGDPLPAGEALV